MGGGHGLSTTTWNPIRNTGPLFGSPDSMFSWEAMGLSRFLYCFGKSLHLLLINEQ